MITVDARNNMAIIKSKEQLITTSQRLVFAVLISFMLHLKSTLLITTGNLPVKDFTQLSAFSECEMNNPLALCELAVRAQTAQIAIGSPISLYRW